MNCNREGVRNFDLGWRIVVKILKMRNYKILPFVRQNFGMAAATPATPLTTSLIQERHVDVIKVLCSSLCTKYGEIIRYYMVE